MQLLERIRQTTNVVSPFSKEHYKFFDNKDVQQIKKIITELVKFKIGEFNLEKIYSNTITSCIDNPKQIFCDNDSIVIDS